MVQVVGIFIALAGLSAVFYALERVFPSLPDQRFWRRDSLLDVLYWFWTPFVTRAMSKAVAGAGAVVALAILGRHVGPEGMRGFGPIARQPQWLVVLEMLFLGDAIGYWTHRAFHHARLWNFHAVHHSSRQLDWLSAVRVHPVNDVLSKLALAVPLACLGFPLNALAGYIPFLTFYSLLLHANLNWSFGPLRYFIASPLFHRWHHTTEEQGLDKNFAPLFPFLDLAFGTFHMPRLRRPERFGTIKTVVPETLIGQLVFPFRKQSHRADVSPTAQIPAAPRTLSQHPRGDEHEQPCASEDAERVAG